MDLHCYAVCSDSDVGKKRNDNEDKVSLTLSELQYPATTDADALRKAINRSASDKAMQVVFCTYHSLEILYKAQQDNDNVPGIGEFDLIICDEAHRTTGQTFEEDTTADISEFIRIHDKDYIKGKKRLYMTATPRIYSLGNKLQYKSIKDRVDHAKKIASDNKVVLYSMDDYDIFGEVFYRLNFGDAVDRNLLCEYKVKILEIKEEDVAKYISLLEDYDPELGAFAVSDAARIIGCWKALVNYPTAQEIEDEEVESVPPLKRAVAFCQVIDSKKGNTKSYRVGSTQISQQFQAVVEAYKKENYDEIEELKSRYPCLINNLDMQCETQHIDGSMMGLDRQNRLSWLKKDRDDNVCRILTNVRCLSEGVDVPALDAVMFLSARASQVDIVQAVGRVMRKSPGKKYGYVIIPVVVTDKQDANKVLANDKEYKVVWQVLCALRSHDEALGADLQRGALGEKMQRIEIVCEAPLMLKKRDNTTREASYNIGRTRETDTEEDDKDHESSSHIQEQLSFLTEREKELAGKLAVRAIEVVGDRKYWENFAREIAVITQKLIENMHTILLVKRQKDGIEPDIVFKRKKFDEFLTEVHKVINEALTKEDAIEFIAQHFVTAPILSAIMGYDFEQNNALAKALSKIARDLELSLQTDDNEELKIFYRAVKTKAGYCTEPKLRDQLLVELYDSFYKIAFPKMVEKLGIVFTPVEVVDAMLRLGNDAMKQHLGVDFNSSEVNVFDPFSGTGTFSSRLLQSDILNKKSAKQLYKKRLHANEIVPLSYYISAINIENAVRGKLGKKGSMPFKGIVYTDTFAIYESKNRDINYEYFAENYQRIQSQKDASINVIMGNPPYSRGQKSANDDNKNVEYPILEERIAETYVKYSNSSGKSSLYNSYVKAYRFATDRLQDKGIIIFVSGSAILNKPSFSGIRKCLAEDFANLYFINLRGDIRVNIFSNGSAGEGGNIFGNTCMTGVCIAILVKDKAATEQGQIFYHDIGDNLTTKQKLHKLSLYNSLKDIEWQKITPNSKNEWIEQTDSDPELYKKYHNYLPLCQKNATDNIFYIKSRGIFSCRDAWVYNYSESALRYNMQNMADFYNSQLELLEADPTNFKRNNDPSKISWTADLNKKLNRKDRASFAPDSIVPSLYRPFTIKPLYYDKFFLEETAQIPSFFPKGREPNKVILVRGLGRGAEFSVLMTDKIPDIVTIDTAECCALYRYNGDAQLYETSRDYNIKPETVQKYQQSLNISLNEEDIFYYIYGILHSPHYRKNFAHILKKEHARIPILKDAAIFQQYSQKGRELADLHLNFENGELYHDAQLILDNRQTTLDNLKRQAPETFLVEKMKYADDTKKTIIYNKYIKITNIAPEIYNYKLNSTPALDIVMRQQQKKTDKASQILQDPNLYALETKQNPAYILELLLRVMHISYKTQAIVSSLPAFEL